jgi:lipopolysaccharide/colanic/teichoic acid biosynthesis glycosyltransferase
MDQNQKTPRPILMTQYNSNPENIATDGKMSTYCGSHTKRVLDIMGAILILTLLAIPTIILCVSHLITREGTVFFIQSRVGKLGIIFPVVKYRTIKAPPIPHEDKQKEEVHDISWTGSILRKSHLDEFPQVVNVIKGDMSLVGPRPYIEEECRINRKKNHLFEYRHQIKPGITGLAQLHYHHNNLDEGANYKLNYDLLYMETASFLMDIKIIAKTIRHAFKFSGV